MTKSDEQIVLHVMKAIAESCKRHNQYIEDMLDSLYQELKDNDENIIFKNDN